MRKIQAKPLTAEGFHPYGNYTSITEPSGNHLGDFYNDQVIYPVAGNMPIAFSPLTIHKASPMTITAAEYHNSTGECIVAMDDDVVIHVAPPTNEPVPELTEAFIVPRGTMVMLKTGVWHYGGYPLIKEEAHLLIVLPERIYMNDCCVVQYEDKDHMEIVL